MAEQPKLQAVVERSYLKIIVTQGRIRYDRVRNEAYEDSEMAEKTGEFN